MNPNALTIALLPVHFLNCYCVSADIILRFWQKQTELAVEPFMLGIPFTELDHPIEAKYFCPCDNDRVKGALGILGVAELQDIIDKGEPQEVVCQMCGKPYAISVDEVSDLKDQLYKNSMH